MPWFDDYYLTIITSTNLADTGCYRVSRDDVEVFGVTLVYAIEEITKLGFPTCQTNIDSVVQVYLIGSQHQLSNCRGALIQYCRAQMVKD